MQRWLNCNPYDYVAIWHVRSTCEPACVSTFDIVITHKSAQIYLIARQGRCIIIYRWIKDQKILPKNQTKISINRLFIDWITYLINFYWFSARRKICFWTFKHIPKSITWQCFLCIVCGCGIHNNSNATESMANKFLIPVRTIHILIDSYHWFVIDHPILICYQNHC